MFIATLFTIVSRHRSNVKCPLTDEWIKKGTWNSIQWIITQPQKRKK